MSLYCGNSPEVGPSWPQCIMFVKDLTLLTIANQGLLRIAFFPAIDSTVFQQASLKLTMDKSAHFTALLCMSQHLQCNVIDRLQLEVHTLSFQLVVCCTNRIPAESTHILLERRTLKHPEPELSGLKADKSHLNDASRFVKQGIIYGFSFIRGRNRFSSMIPVPKYIFGQDSGSNLDLPVETPEISGRQSYTYI